VLGADCCTWSLCFVLISVLPQTDVDMVLLRNPFNYIGDLPACDLFSAVDTLPPPMKSDDAKRWSMSNDNTSVWFNTGFMLWRSSNASQAVIEAFLGYLENQGEGLDDQAHFYAFMQAQGQVSSGNQPWAELAHTCATWAGLSFQALPPVLFASQRHLYEFKLAQEAYVLPYSIHFNWLSGFEEKKKRMVEVGLW
jgi:hypothetical protein